jgi:ribosome-binding factor A
MRNQRQLRVGEEIRHALATILMKGDVPWPKGFPAPASVSVTEVRISPDLKNATAFVMPLGGLHLRETVKALNDISGFFRHEIAQTVTLRYAPKLNFLADESFAYAQRIDDILHKPAVAKDLRDEGLRDEDDK